MRAKIPEFSSNRIDAAFARLKREKRKALIAYVTGGFPSLPAMDKTVKDLQGAGVDIVEVGVPFSDPIADGPTIQWTSQKALESGATLVKILNWVRRFRSSSALPVVLMTYYNPVFHRGLDRFAREAAEAGVDGLVVPDLIPEEAGPLRAALDRKGIHLIALVAPTTPLRRQKWIAEQSRGFLYAVSLTGVTGSRTGVGTDVPAFLRGLRRVSPVPVAVGFGISRGQDARRLAPSADGVIVGSALMQRLIKKESVVPLARELRAALN